MSSLKVRSINPDKSGPASQLKLVCSKYKQFHSACLLGALIRQLFKSPTKLSKTVSHNFYEQNEKYNFTNFSISPLF